LSLLSKNLSLLVLWKAFGFRSHHISHWNWRSKGLNYLATLASLSFSVKRKIIRPLLSLTPDLDCWEIHNILSLPWFGWRLQFSFEIFSCLEPTWPINFFFIKQFVIPGSFCKKTQSKSKLIKGYTLHKLIFFTSTINKGSTSKGRLIAIIIRNEKKLHLIYSSLDFSAEQ